MKASARILLWMQNKEVTLCYSVHMQLPYRGLFHGLAAFGPDKYPGTTCWSLFTSKKDVFTTCLPSRNNSNDNQAFVPHSFRRLANKSPLTKENTLNQLHICHKRKTGYPTVPPFTMLAFT